MLRILSRWIIAATAFVVIGSGLIEQNQAQAQCSNCDKCANACRSSNSWLDRLRCNTCRQSRGLFGSNCKDGQGCREKQYGQPDLFYNYYVAPGCGYQPAQMYISPGPVPAVVGHTYVTYQPFMPHEWMYPHERTYHRYYDDGRGLTRTKVSWYAPPAMPSRPFAFMPTASATTAPSGTEPAPSNQ